MILTTVLCGVAAAALQPLKSQPENTPPRWYQSDDPCEDPWVVVAATIQGSLHCHKTILITGKNFIHSGLSTISLKGNLRTCNLTQTLQDLSLHGYENCKTCTSCEMKYPIFYMASRLISFFLEKIKAIAFYVSFLQLFRILSGCGFSDSIPDELGNLAELSIQ
ncbi:hypothetical protein POTOM_036062 [Populus tomentosa]|uniref:Uncharacterized protein n=1 Tax=Populus tomentosa TaxID=118781 RepID=A0A8X8CMP7_POPTO|nr:hypothetical protein POTOM_036062 [Populus tomentosa]